MGNRNFNPKTMYENQRPIVRAQPTHTDNNKPFAAGAFQDLESSLVPANGVHVVQNYRVYPWGLLTRGGCQLWSATTLPAISGKTGMSVTKSGYNVIRTAGPHFDSSDLNRYIVHDDGKHDKILEVESTSRVRVEFNTDHDASTAAWVRGLRGSVNYHKKHGVLVLHIDNRIFYSPSVRIPSWTQIYKTGTCSDPAEELSRISIYGDYAILWNSNGPYKIDLENFLYWKINTPIPTERITDVESSDEDYSERRYLYSMLRLSGGEAQLYTDIDRFTDGVSIQQESGTVAPDSSRKDYSSVFTERPVGQPYTAYGLLTGGALSSPHDTIAGWSTYTVVQFGMTMNSQTRNVVANISGAVSLSEIAERLQLGLRDYWPDAICEFDTDHFVIKAPKEGSSVDYVSAGDGATDIGTSIMQCHSGVATSEDPDYTEPSTIGNLEIPINANGLYDAHWTHYSLYSTLVIGGSNPVNNDINNEELFIWNSDIPVAKAFVVSTSGSTFYISVGVLVTGDKGCKLRFTDGNEYTIATVDSIVQGTFEETPSSDYTDASCALGGDDSESKAMRVMTASQSGTTVTRTAGDIFTSADVGRPLFFSNSIIRWIKSYTDANNVEVKESGTIASTACGIEPKIRKYTDILRDEPRLTDESLRARVRNYTLQNRLFVPIPDCDMGEVTPNMIWGCIKGEYIVHYSQADVNYQHQAGYYYESEQREIFEDKLNEISKVGGVLSVKMNNSTRSIPLNSFDSIVISDAGTAIIKALGNDVVDESIGCLHQGGVCYTPDNLQIVITSEPAIRTFDGVTYGDNLASNRIMKILNKIIPEYSSWYDPVNGWTFNGKMKVDT